MKYDLITDNIQVENICFGDVVMIDGEFHEVVGYELNDKRVTLYFNNGVHCNFAVGSRLPIAKHYEILEDTYHKMIKVVKVDMSELYEFDRIVIDGAICIVLSVHRDIGINSCTYIDYGGVETIHYTLDKQPKIIKILDVTDD